jgi:hypothetical protein
MAMENKTYKKCTKCGETNPLEEFPFAKGGRDGKRGDCKICFATTKRHWREKNVEHCQEYNHRWFEENKKKRREYVIRYHKENVGKRSEWCKNWRERNPEKVKAYSDKIQSTEEYRLSRRERRKDPAHCLDHRMSTAVQIALRENKAGRKWEILVGYTLNDLKQHLEKLFRQGMSWENIGKWHVDHIIPKALFNYEMAEDIDFKRCWSLGNLQPLWAEENFKKHSRMVGIFQPSLTLTT